MKQKRIWRESVTVTVLLSVAVAVAPNAVADTAMPRDIQRFVSEQTSLWSDRPVRVAQQVENQPTENQQNLQQTETRPVSDPENCRRVSTSRNNNLIVRDAPSGQIIGALANGILVTIVNRGANGWVPISSPGSGYVASAFLSPCDEQPAPPSQTATSTDNCRQVTARGGLWVRENSSVTSPILGRIANGQEVNILNRGANGWVPITLPTAGYVSSSFLRYCS